MGGILTYFGKYCSNVIYFLPFLDSGYTTLEQLYQFGTIEYEMADRTCPQCGKRFAFPSRLKKHMERKTPCAPLLNPTENEVTAPPAASGRQYSCEYCGRSYAHQSNLSRHRKRSCKLATKDPMSLRMVAQLQRAKDNRIEDQYRQLEAQAAKLEALNQKVDKLTESIVARSDGGGGGAPANITNTNIIAGDVNIINFNSFGNEDISHMKDFTRSLLESGRSALEVMELLGKKRWADLKYPQNGTMYTPNVKDTRIRTRRADGKWETRDRTVVYCQAHTALTDQAYNAQPKTEKGALAADPILKTMDAIDKGEEPFPVGVYNAIAESGRVHQQRFATP